MTGMRDLMLPRIPRLLGRWSRWHISLTCGWSFWAKDTYAGLNEEGGSFSWFESNETISRFLFPGRPWLEVLPIATLVCVCIGESWQEIILYCLAKWLPKSLIKGSNPSQLEAGEGVQALQKNLKRVIVCACVSEWPQCFPLWLSAYFLRLLTELGAHQPTRLSEFSGSACPSLSHP